MALPTSGSLTLAQIQTEFGGSNPISLNEYYAGGANVPSGTSGTNGAVPSSGAISIANFYGTAKSTRVSINYVFSSSTANASLNLSSIGGYSAGQSDITVTINSGVYLYATTTGGYGLNLSGATTGDTVTIVNNGNIMGMGGDGVNGGTGVSNLTGGSGGPALNLGIGVNPTINNQSGYIGGGGGAGGGWYVLSYSITQSWGGAGGAGGGKAGNCFLSTVGTAIGGSGGGLGSSGNNGNSVTVGSSTVVSGGGGGRVFPSTTTTRASNGTILVGLGGSGGGTHGFFNTAAGTFSNGGGPNQAGSFSGTGVTAGAGGGYGASGDVGHGAAFGVANSAGGSGGKGVNLNGRSVTWTGGSASTNRVFGAIS